MYRIYFILLLFVIISCKQSSSNPSSVEPEVSVDTEEIESISSDSLGSAVMDDLEAISTKDFRNWTPRDRHHQALDPQISYTIRHHQAPKFLQEAWNLESGPKARTLGI